MTLIYWFWAGSIAVLVSFIANVLAGLAAGTARTPSFALLGVTLALTLIPGFVLRSGMPPADYALILLFAASLCLGVAMVCLARLRRKAWPAWLPPLGIAAALHLWGLLLFVFQRWI